MHWLIDKLTDFSERDFLIQDEERFTYGALGCAVSESLELLHKYEIRKGQTVALHGDYCLQSVAWLLALLEHGCIAVPIAPSANEEVQTRLRIARCDHVIAFDGAEVTHGVLTPDGEAHGLVKSLQERGVAGLILFSSGTTGEPKAMIHDFDRLVESFRGRRPKSMKLLVFLMFDHIGGLNTLLGALASGMSIAVPASRDPIAVAELIESEKLAVLPASPTFLNLMLLKQVTRKCDLSSLKIITYGTEPMPDSLLKRLKEAFPRARFIQTFGTSETGINQTASKSSDSTLMRIDDPNIEHKIVEGELWLRSKTQILGYLNASMERFTEDGWFKTGDVTEVTDDGYIRIVGRRTDAINVGGEKVFPAEVEGYLQEMEGVTDASVGASASPLVGQMVVASVALDTRESLKDFKRRMRRHLADKLAPYKIPQKVRFIQDADELVSSRFKKLRRS